MNLFSKFRSIVFIICLLFGCLFSGPVQAVMVSGIYTGSCERKLGVILGVNSYNLKILTLDGQVESLPRYQVIQLVTYAVENLTFSTAARNIAIDSVPAFHISTLTGFREETLVDGYPIDFTTEKVAFLTREGGEVLIDKVSIAHLEKLASYTLEPDQSLRPVKFSHSYSFQNCEKNVTEGPTDKALSIHPEQILSDALTIKRELDRLQHGFELMDRYIEQQSFYAKPLLYTNKTRLGIWKSFGSRYGQAEGRTNDFTPILNSEYASDIYDYQRILSTGSQPNILFEHEEAQTQALFAFKASYFHFMAYLDPNIILSGDNYSYKKTDLDDGDIKISSQAGMELGVDHGAWQFGLLTSTLNFGTSWQNTLVYGRVPLTKIHLKLSSFIDDYELIAGSGSAEDMDQLDATGKKLYSAIHVDASHLRLNYTRHLNAVWYGTASLIHNHYALTDRNTGANFAGDSQSISVLINFSFSKRFNSETMFSYEKFDSDSLSKSYPKLGTSLHLFF